MATTTEDRNVYPKARRTALNVPKLDNGRAGILPQSNNVSKAGKSTRVRRKLAFNTDDDEDDDLDGGLDFTDKIAAFRSLFKPMKNIGSWSNGRKLTERTPTKQINDTESKFASKVHGNGIVERSKVVRSALERQTDEELAKMSFINFQAHMHMMESKTATQPPNSDHGQKQDSDSLQVTKNFSCKLREKSSVSRDLKKHEQGQRTEHKRGCANFSEGLENKHEHDENGKDISSSIVDQKKVKLVKHNLHTGDKLVQDNVNISIELDSQRNSNKVLAQGSVDDDYLAKFDRNVDRTDHRNQQTLHCDTANVIKGRSDSSCGSDTLTDIGSLLNSTVVKKGAKIIQSNVPHYHPAWSRDDSLSTNHRSAVKKTTGKLRSANFSPKHIIDKVVWDDGFEMSEFASSLVYESRHRRDFVDSSPENELNDKIKRGNLKHHNNDGCDTKKDASDPVKRNSHSHKTSRNKVRRKSPDGKQSRHRKVLEEEDIGLVSDSSKENIPDLNTVTKKVSERPDVSRKASQRNRNIIDNEWKNDTNGVSDFNLQLVPKADIHMVSRTHRDSDSRNSDVSITGSLQSSESQSSVINAAELIKKLYKVDKKSREELVLKARFFRRWLKVVRRNKRNRHEGRPLEQNAESPIEYVDKQAATHQYVQSLDLDLIQNDAYESLLHVKNDDTLVDTHDSDQPISDPGDRNEEVNYATRDDKKLMSSSPIKFDKYLSNAGEQGLDYKLQTSPDNSLSDENLPSKTFSGPREIWQRDSSGTLQGRSSTIVYNGQMDTEGESARHVYTQQWQQVSKSQPRQVDGYHSQPRVVNENHIRKNSAEKPKFGEKNKEEIKTFSKKGSTELSKSSELQVQVGSVDCMLELGELKKRALHVKSLLGSNQQTQTNFKDPQKEIRMTQRASCQTDQPLDDRAKVTKKVERKDGTCQVETFTKGSFQDQSSNTVVSSMNPHREMSTMTTMSHLHRRKGDPPTTSLNQNLQIADIEQQLLDTANYGVCLQRSESFCRHRILANYFHHWRITATAAAKVRRADQLHKEHTLRKGLMALKWAINRSRIQEDILHSRMQIIVLRSKFVKWRDKAMKNRYERLHKSFNKWKTYTVESQRIRKLRHLRERKILLKALDQWKAVLCMRLKENRAVNHFRKNLLMEKIIVWKLYTARAKEKKHRQEAAVCFYNERLQSKMFEEMVVVYRKYNAAKTHHRKHMLHQVLVAWKHSAHVCKVERQRDMSISKEHRRLVTIRSFFSQWHEQMLTQRACNSANKKLSRKTFMLWKTRWEENVKHREEEESRIREEILHASIQLWKANVDLLQKRRLAAVIYVQRVLVRHYIHQWCYYTQHRKELRVIQTRYTQTKNLAIERKCFRQWRRKFEDKLDIQRAKQFWSNTCVRKAIAQWKKVCHRRSLDRLLIATEPSRQLALQRVVFQRWLSAKTRVEEEKQSASEVRAILQQSQLQKRFHAWWIATQRQLTVKPLMLRRKRRFLADIFDSWRDLVQHKIQCKKSRDQFVKTQLRARFTAWRCQYLIHLLEKDIYKKTLQSLLQRCVTSWRQYITRKQAALNLHSKAVITHTFYYWRDKAFGQLNRREEELEVKEYNTGVLKRHFGLWLHNVQEQITHEDGIVTSLREERETNRLHKAFISWRRLFRASIVARENQKLLSRRLQQKVIQEWQENTQYTLREAVHNFAVSLGLESPYCEEFNTQTTSTPRTTDSESLPDLAFGAIEIMDLERSYPRSGFGSGFVSPRSSPVPGTPLKRISLDRMSTPDESRPSLAHSGFLDAKFAMEQAVKTDRLRTLVMIAVKRLRNWPVSLAFEQWREHTVRQRELKQLSKQLVNFCHMSKMKLALRVWKSSLTASLKATEYRERMLKRKTFCILYEHKCEGRRKKHLSALAHNHISLNVFRKVFPYWYNKAQEKRHKETVLNLWTTVTQEEQNLLPLEREVKGRLHNKTLQKCFALWSLKFQQIHRLKTAFNRVILQRYMDVWHDWASHRRNLRDKHIVFCNNRLTNQMFRMWCLRCQQKQEVERKHKQVWQQNLVEIVRIWHVWTVGARQRNMLYRHCKENREKNVMTKTLLLWQQLTVKQQEVKAWYHRRLTVKVLYAWSQVATLQKKRKKQILEFQVRCYTKLVLRMFYTWHSSFMDRLQQHEEHEKMVYRHAVQLGRKWKHKAQKSRGQHLQQKFLKERLRRCFNKWHDGYQRILEREDQLARYLVRQEWHVIGHYMDVWKTALLCQQAGRVYNNKLTVAVFSEWLTFTRESRERKRKCQMFKQASQQRSLVASFQYWVQITTVRTSVEHHFNLKLQIRILRAWCLYARQQRQLSRLSAIMTKRVNTRILQKTWYFMRGQYDYFHSLTDIADKVVQDKNRKKMQHTLCRWRERLNRVIAGQCYQHMLTVRVVRTWRRFVYCRKQERQKDAEMWQLAIYHHNRKICKAVLEAWKDEIKIVHQIQRHKNRLAAKYGKLWKLRVDMAYTAQLVEKENCYKKFWRIWRLEYSTRSVATKVSLYSSRQLLAQVFVSWKSLCAKQRSKKHSSSMPILRLPTSCDSTPVASPRPSQIPTLSYSGRMQQNSGSLSARLRERRTPRM